MLWKCFFVFYLVLVSTLGETPFGDFCFYVFVWLSWKWLSLFWSNLFKNATITNVVNAKPKAWCRSKIFDAKETWCRAKSLMPKFIFNTNDLMILYEGLCTSTFVNYTSNYKIKSINIDPNKIRHSSKS